MQMASFATSMKALYIDFVDDRATHVCFHRQQVMGVFPNIKTSILLDFLSSKSPPQSRLL